MDDGRMQEDRPDAGDIVPRRLLESIVTELQDNLLASSSAESGEELQGEAVATPSSPDESVPTATNSSATVSASSSSPSSGVDAYQEGEPRVLFDLPDNDINISPRSKPLKFYGEKPSGVRLSNLPQRQDRTVRSGSHCNTPFYTISRYFLMPPEDESFAATAYKLACIGQDTNRHTVARDYVGYRFAVDTRAKFGSNIMRLIVVGALGVVLMGLAGGFMMFHPAVYPQTVTLQESDSKISVSYTNETSWHVHARFLGELRMWNLSRMNFQLNNQVNSNGQTCVDPGYTRRERQLGMLRTSINSTDPSRWNQHPKQSKEELVVEIPQAKADALDMKETSTSGSLFHKPMGWFRTQPKQAFVAYFSLGLPSLPEKEFMEICYLDRVGWSNQVLSPGVTELSLQCNALVSPAMDVNPECTISVTQSSSETSFFKEPAQTQFKRLKQNARPTGPLDRLSVRELHEACDKYGFVWAVLTLEHMVVWSVGARETLPFQTVKPVVVACSTFETYG